MRHFSHTRSILTLEISMLWVIYAPHSHCQETTMISGNLFIPYLLTFSASHCCIHCCTPATALRLCNSSSMAPLSIATGSSSSALPCRWCATLARRERARRITSSLNGGLGGTGLGVFFALIPHFPLHLLRYGNSTGIHRGNP